jgi:hypothetical protein
MESPFLPPVSADVFWCLVFDVCPCPFPATCSMIGPVHFVGSGEPTAVIGILDGQAQPWLIDLAE